MEVANSRQLGGGAKAKPSCDQDGFFLFVFRPLAGNSGPTRIRTWDQPVMSRPLCR